MNRDNNITNILKEKLFLGLVYYLIALIFIGSPIFDFITIKPAFAYETAIKEIESNNNGLKVIEGSNYQDGTILLRLLNPLNSCNESTIYLRLIHTNGSVSTLDLKHLSIPRNNFCNKSATTTSQASDSSYNDSITIHAISYEYVLINYFCDRSISNKVCGNVVTWKGKSVSKIEFEDICDESRIIQSHKNDYEFLRVCYLKNSRKIIWKKYTVPNFPTGTIFKVSSGNLTNVANFNLNITNFFSTEDGNFAMVTCTSKTTTTTTNNSSSNAISSNQFADDWSISVTFLPENNSSQPKGPFELYKSKTTDTGSLDTVNIRRCDLAYYSSGYSCLISIVRSANVSFINVDFVSSGKVSVVTPEFSISQIGTTTIWDVQTLYYGGYVILVKNSTGNVEGHICSNNGTYFGNWGFSTQYYQYTNEIAGVLPNNTLWTIPKPQADDHNSWTCLLSDILTTYTTVQNSNNNSNSSSSNNVTINSFPEGSGGYGSNSILSTIPEKNSNSVSTTNTDWITITYTNPIKASTGKINIYQTLSNSTKPTNDDGYYEDSQDLLRQSCFGQSDYVQISNESTIQIKVLKSTFNNPGNEYYVTIEDDFVKDSATDQNLIGIHSKIWNFSTVLNKDDGSYVHNDPDSVDCIIRLTPKGTSYYTSLSTDDQADFVGRMSMELSEALPCDVKRVTTLTKYQYSHNNNNNNNNNNDIGNHIFENIASNVTTSSTDQIFMRIEIEETLSRTGLNATQLASDLDELIKNKDVTLLSRGLYTDLIDSEYGAVQLEGHKEKFIWIYMIAFIGSSLIMFAIVWALISFRKYRVAQGFFTVVMFTVIMMDFCLDIVFVTIHGKDFKWLYPISVTFIVLPICFNMLFTCLMVTCNSSTSTSKRIGRNKLTKTLFFILSSIDLDLSFMLASYNEFSSSTAIAPEISETSRKTNSTFSSLSSTTSSTSSSTSSSSSSSFFSSSSPSRGKLSVNNSNKLILIGRVFSLIVEDIAQLIILISYQEFSIIPATTPMLVLSTCATVLISKLIFIVFGKYVNSFFGHDGGKQSGSNLKRRNGARRKIRKFGKFGSMGNILKSGNDCDYDEYDDRRAIIVNKPMKEKGIDSIGVIRNNRKKKNLSIISSSSSSSGSSSTIKEEVKDDDDTNSVMSISSNNDYGNKISNYGAEKKKKITGRDGDGKEEERKYVSLFDEDYRKPPTRTRAAEKNNTAKVDDDLNMVHTTVKNPFDGDEEAMTTVINNIDDKKVDDKSDSFDVVIDSRKTGSTISKIATDTKITTTENVIKRFEETLNFGNLIANNNNNNNNSNNNGNSNIIDTAANIVETDTTKKSNNNQIKLLTTPSRLPKVLTSRTNAHEFIINNYTKSGKIIGRENIGISGGGDNNDGNEDVIIIRDAINSNGSTRGIKNISNNNRGKMIGSGDTIDGRISDYGELNKTPTIVISDKEIPQGETATIYNNSGMVIGDEVGTSLTGTVELSSSPVSSILSGNISSSSHDTITTSSPININTTPLFLPSSATTYVINTSPTSLTFNDDVGSGSSSSTTTTTTKTAINNNNNNDNNKNRRFSTLKHTNHIRRKKSNNSVNSVSSTSSVGSYASNNKYKY